MKGAILLKEFFCGVKTFQMSSIENSPFKTLLWRETLPKDFKENHFQSPSAEKFPSQGLFSIEGEAL